MAKENGWDRDKEERTKLWKERNIKLANLEISSRGQGNQRRKDHQEGEATVKGVVKTKEAIV